MDAEEVNALITKQLEDFGKNTLSEVVNRAITGHKSRLKDDILKDVVGQVGGVLDEKLKGLKPNPKSDGDPPKDGGADSEELKLLRARLEKIEADNKVLEEEAAGTRRKEDFSKAVKAAGLTEVDILYPAFKDNIKTTSDGKYFVGDVPMEEALVEFSKTDKGKRFRPAKAGSGSDSAPSTSDEPVKADANLGEVVQGLIGEMMSN